MPACNPRIWKISRKIGSLRLTQLHSKFKDSLTACDLGFKNKTRANEMAEQVKALVTELEDLSSTPRVLLVKKEKQVLKDVL